MLAVIGIAAVIHPAPLDDLTMRLHFPAMLAFTLTLFFMAYNYRGIIQVSRSAGLILLTGFVVYQATVAVNTF